MTTLNHSPAVTDTYQLDVLGTLRRKFGTILFFVIVASSLALLYFFKAPKTYESKAKVFVDERQGPSVSADGEAFSTETPVEKYMEIISSTAVLNEAIENAKAADMESMIDVDDVLVEVRENLIIKSSDTKGMSGVMNVKFQGPVPADCENLLRCIVDSFGKYVTKSSEDTGGSALETMSQIKVAISDRFEDIEKQIRELSVKPHLQFNKDGLVMNPHQEQANKLQEELDEMKRSRTRLEARRKKLKQAKELGNLNESMVMDALQEINDGSLGGYVTTHQEFVRLKVREKELSGLFGAEHPDLVAIRKQIEMVDKMRMQELSALRVGEQENNEKIDNFAIVINHLDNRIELMKAEEESLNEEMEAEKVNANQIANDVELLKALLRDRDRQEKAYFAAVERLGEYNALKDFNWREMRVLDPPSLAEQAAPNLILSIMAGLILGSMFGFVFAALKEMAEKTFRSSEEVAQHLGTRVVAHIPEFQRRQRRAAEHREKSHDLVMLHAPGSVAAESYRALRTSLYFKSQSSDCKTVMITSPSPSDGKSTVAANLAVAIAQSNRRVLLVDCDLRKPSQHKRFQLKNRLGITSCITGSNSLEEVMEDVGVENLSVITSGPQYANPSELLTSDQFPAILKELRNSFDFVIVDSPPVLPVTDPTIIAPMVDAVFLPIRIGKGVQVNAKIAIEAMESVGVSVDGVIVNGVKRNGSYGYGQNQYGYGRYGNRQSYGNASQTTASLPLQTSSR